MSTKNETSYREKGRALFLAALMVLSVVAMSAAFAGGAAADVDDEYTTASSAGESVYQGTIYNITDDDGNEDTLNDFSTIESAVDLETSDGDWIRELTIEEADDDDSFDHYVEIDTGTLDTGTYNVTEIGDTTDGYFEFDVRTHGIDAEFDDDSVTNVGSSDTELDIDSERSSFHANVSADGLDYEDLANIFVEEVRTGGTDVDDYTPDGDVVALDDDDDVITLDARGTFDADFYDIDEGEYTFEINASDTSASDTAVIEVVDDDVDLEFTEGTFTEERGDIANITIALDNTDEAAVQIGEYEDVSYEVGLTVDADDYDEVTVQMNTYYAGLGDGDFDEEDVWTVAEDDASVTLEYLNVSDDSNENYVNPDGALEGYTGDAEASLDAAAIDYLSNSLAEGDYELTVGDEWVLGADGEIDVSPNDEFWINNDEDTAYLTLNERLAPGEGAIHTAPQADDMSDLEDFEDATVTETDLIADEDRMLFTVEDFGLTGLLDDDRSNLDINEALASEGIHLEIEQADPPANADADVWNSSYDLAGYDEGDFDDEVELLELDFVNVEDYDGEYLILEVDYDSSGLDVDEEYDVTFQMTEDGEFIDDEDDEVEQEFTFDLEEPEIEWDQDPTEIGNFDGATATGSTNTAPGSEVDYRAHASGEFTESDDTVVDDDRTFTATFDFEGEAEGIEFDLEASQNDFDEYDVEDEVDGILVEADEGDPADLSGDVSFDPADPEDGDDVSATVDVSNAGDMNGTTDVELVFDGDTLIDEEDVEITGSGDVNFDAMTGELAEGDYDWSLYLDGDEEDSGTLSVGEEAEDDDTDADDGDGDDISDDDDDDDDGMPGFGVAVALVALLSAAMLALRRQD